MSALMGMRVGASSSSSRRELRRRLGSFGSRRGRLAGVAAAMAGLGALDIMRGGLASVDGAGGSSALNGDGEMLGIRSKLAR